MNILRAAMIGDVVGEPGVKILEEKLPEIIKNNSLDFIVVNGENAADGFGMTETLLKRILACGVDVVTSGNHIWEKREFLQTLEINDNILRPANYPETVAGRGWLFKKKAGITWVIINLQGRDLMTAIDCPFRCFDNIISRFSNASKNHTLFDESGNPLLPGLFPVTIVDFHAESTREKESLGYYIDGRCTLIAGTHTHIQTADERILPKGTAYITDLGMTGNTESVIGMDINICTERMRRQILYRMEPAAENTSNEKNTAQVNGIIAEINADTGKAVSIKRLINI